MSNHTHGFIWDTITYPCINFSGSLTKLHLKLGMAELLQTIVYLDILTYAYPNPDAG